jgi:hypothetical protein
MAMLRAMGMCQGIVGLGKYLRGVDYVVSVHAIARITVNTSRILLDIVTI